MKYIAPQDITLIDSSIPESDAAWWEPDLNYSEGVKVISYATAFGWEKVPSNAGGYKLYDVAYGNGIFMTGTNTEIMLTFGHVLTSGDAGETWTRAATAPKENMSSFAYGASVWVAIGVECIYSSANAGVTWTLRHTRAGSGSYREYNKVRWNGSLFVAVGGFGGIVTSPDGITWTARSVPGAWTPAQDQTHALNDVHYADSTWVAVGYTNRVITSADGVTWALATTGLAADKPWESLYGVIHDGTTWHVVGAQRQYITSADAASWTIVNNVGSSAFPQATSIISGSGLLLVTTIPGDVYVSEDDGATWVATTTDFPGQSRQCAHYDGDFIAVGFDGAISITTATALTSDTERKPYIYESLDDDNLGYLPRSNPEKWLDLGSINKYRMFDPYIVSQTTGEDEIQFVIDGSLVTTAALFGLDANEVKFELITDYDTVDEEVIYEMEVDLVYNNQSVSWSEYFFGDFDKKNDIWVDFDAISYDASLRVTITGVGFVSVGKVVIGKAKDCGLTQMGPIVGIMDFSRVVDDDFGRTTLVKRSFAKKMEVDTFFLSGAASSIQKNLAAIRATPTAWLGDNGLGYEALLVYGVFRDFSVTISRQSPTLSEGRMEIRGMI